MSEPGSKAQRVSERWLARMADLSPVLVGGVGVLLSVVLWQSLLASERRVARSALERDAAQRIARVQRERTGALEALRSVAALFDSSMQVESEEFRTFVSSGLERHEAVRALAWIEHTQRGAAPFDPVAFVQGPEGRSLAPGSEPGRFPEWRAALARAGQPGEVVLSAPLELPEGTRVLAALPVFGHDGPRTGELQGRVALLLDVARLLPASEAGAALCIEDVTAEPALLAGSAAEDPLDVPPEVEALGGRRWRTSCVPEPGFAARYGSGWPLGVLLLGLVATAAAVTTLFLATSRKRIQSLVERRTREVVASYDTLASEAEERRAATQEARESQEQLREILDLVPSQIYVKDRHGRLLMANLATADALGYTVDELTLPSAVDVNADERDVSPDLLEDRRLMQGSKTVIVPDQPFVDAQGRRRRLRLAKIPCRASGERALLCVATDVTEQRQAEIVVQSQNRLLGELARGTAPAEVLRHAVETAEKVVPGLRCSVLFLAPDRRHLVHGLAPSLPEAYSQAIDGLAIGPEAGSCGAAAHLGRRFVVEDVLQHPNWADYRELARSANVRACWSEPIRSTDGEILGTFAMYYAEPRKPEPYEERFMESMAHLAGIAIERGHLATRA